MSDSEVLNYFIKKKQEETVCGRAFPDQLDRNIYAAAQKKKYWQWQYILTAFLFFMKPAKSKAQGAIAYIAADTACSILPVKEKKQSNKSKAVTGIIKDEEGKPVPYASVKVAGTTIGTSADEEGKFSLTIDENEMLLFVSSLSYESKKVMISDKEKNEIVLKKNVKVMDEVVIQSEYRTRRMGGMAGGISVCRISRTRIITDTIKSWVNSFKPAIKIYPNPAPKGSSFTISMKLKQTGNFTIQITDAAGRLITEKKTNTASKEWNEQVAIGSTWGAGMYYVRILKEEKKIVTTGNLIVQ
jgi:flagellar hook assembly protein FlgD